VQAQLAASGSDVDPAREAVEQIQAVQQYRASVALLAVDDRLQKSALDMLR
jgi:flagellar basal body rod protein FlgC